MNPPFDELIQIVARLRAPQGCPWDRAQTAQSLRPYLLEETYEVLDAIDRNDDHDLRKELGDVLFQVVMLAHMAEERQAFDLDQVVRDVNTKMVERHPHVFDPNYVSNQNEGDVASWEARKAAKRKPGDSALDGVPEPLPALLRAHRISEKASRVGFDWPDRTGVREKLDEELAELDEALALDDRDALAEELGDVLFTLVNLGRHLPTGAESCLRLATNRFSNRFRALERSLAAEGRTIFNTDPDTLESRWRALKNPSGESRR
ncbi:MAG: nucleoside triphosphate pyrophosphohydrolase [Proteobacteria bacterium]|nr:nucleoside triphosphate pyrophosphohydrolase [Pseudomonadota bacterium]